MEKQKWAQGPTPNQEAIGSCWGVGVGRGSVFFNRVTPSTHQPHLLVGSGLAGQHKAVFLYFVFFKGKKESWVCVGGI